MSLSFWIIILSFSLTEGLKLLPRPKTSSSCGGTLVGGGVIEYKMGQSYLQNERCVWTLVNNRNDLVTLDLISANFAESGDNLEIFYKDELTSALVNPVASGNPHCDGPILSNTGGLCKLNSSLVFIIFRSNDILQGTGFSLKIETIEQSYPPRDVYEAYSLTTSEGSLDYDGSFGESNKFISWTLLNPNSFVLYKFNTSKSGHNNSCINSPTPSLRIYQANKGNPNLLEKACGGISQPLQFIQAPILVEPFILIFEGGSRGYSKGEIKFYWNLEEPPSEWVPEPGLAFKMTATSFTIFFTIFLLF